MPDLNERNLRSWQIWSTATRLNRQSGMGGLGTLTTDSILELCELYDATIEEFERIVATEKEMYPVLAAKAKADSEGGNNGRREDSTRDS